MAPAWALDGDGTVWTRGSTVPRGLGGDPMPEAVMSPADRSDWLVDNGTEASPRLRSAQCLPAANEGMDRSTCRAASDKPHRTGQDRTPASP
jgi:hypothetical protein